jgi:hypothetical protein
VAGLLPPGSEITSVQLHAGHEVWTRRYTGDPERGGAPLARHEEGYRAAHAVPVDHVVKTDDLTPVEVADADRLDHEPDVYVSTATIWEVAIKQAIGKLPQPTRLPERIQESGFRPLPISADRVHSQGRSRLDAGAGGCLSFSTC